MTDVRSTVEPSQAIFNLSSDPGRCLLLWGIIYTTAPAKHKMCSSFPVKVKCSCNLRHALWKFHYLNGTGLSRPGKDDVCATNP
ncbi:hypothetical protein XELAEV_18008454mg [Xenopus laevis]|uniref:Uncharacterized protein n=1 Tax=Xenopus laevis TaxID=8355 RepID=A0A974E4F9_XENLA|nr:hypothetical protein XELAEV_18008454mg [Xenopus laevis]